MYWRCSLSSRVGSRPSGRDHLVWITIWHEWYWTNFWEENPVTMPRIGWQLLDEFNDSTLKVFVQKSLLTISVGADPIQKTFVDDQCQGGSHSKSWSRLNRFLRVGPLDSQLCARFPSSHSKGLIQFCRDNQSLRTSLTLPLCYLPDSEENCQHGLDPLNFPTF
jgi:hypothetical protein